MWLTLEKINKLVVSKCLGNIYALIGRFRYSDHICCVCVCVCVWGGGGGGVGSISGCTVREREGVVSKLISEGKLSTYKHVSLIP